MKSVTICLAILLVLSAIAKAQEPLKTEYGKPAELKGLTKLFVDTGGDTEQRNRILKEFEKEKLPGLTLLDSSDDAQVILFFGGSKVAYTRGQVTQGTGSVGTDYRSTGKGVAFIPKPPNTMRILLSVESVKYYVWTAKPEVKFVRDFIKAYKVANGLK